MIVRTQVGYDRSHITAGDVDVLVRLQGCTRYFDGCAQLAYRIVRSACLHSRLSSRFYEACKRPFDRQSDDVAHAIGVFRANMRRSLRIGMSAEVKRHTLLFSADLLIVSYLQAYSRRDDETGSFENLPEMFQRDEISETQDTLEQKKFTCKSWGARQSKSKTPREDPRKKRSSDFQFDMASRVTLTSVPCSCLSCDAVVASKTWRRIW